MEEKNQNTIKSQKRPKGYPDEKGIAEGLSNLKSAGRLKSENPVREDTLESKMPSRVEEPEDDIYKGIKIPTPKRPEENSETGQGVLARAGLKIRMQAGFKKEATITSSDVHGQPLVYEKGKIEAAKRTLQEPNEGLIKKVFGGGENNRDLSADIFKTPVADKEASNQRMKQEDSIFGGKLGVSRRTLRREMMTDPEIKKAARLTRLGLSPTERANLVKEVFAPVLGANISERDLNQSLRKLNRKLRSTEPSSKEHGQLRKEIKFFKKIGGMG